MIDDDWKNGVKFSASRVNNTVVEKDAFSIFDIPVMRKALLPLSYCRSRRTLLFIEAVHVVDCNKQGTTGVIQPQGPWDFQLANNY
jgi:hypothetical protein